MDEVSLGFGRYRLDLSRRQLLRDQRPVPLGGRALDVLCVLASARGALVTRQRRINVGINNCQSSFPSGFVQPLKHMRIVLGPLPRHSLVGVKFERSWRNRDCLVQGFFRYASLPEAAERCREPTVTAGKLGA